MLINLARSANLPTGHIFYFPKFLFF